MPTLIQYLGTGRRKTATARVFLRPGAGAFTINGKGVDEFFTTVTSRAMVKQPLLATEVRAAGRPEAVPVLQALTFDADGPFRFRVCAQSQRPETVLNFAGMQISLWTACPAER